MSTGIAYTFTVDLVIGDTTPGFVVSWNKDGQPKKLPSCQMPRFHKGDTIEFVFDGRVVTHATIYARPLMELEPMSPFVPNEHGKTDILRHPKITVDRENGSWCFDIAGFYTATNLFGHPPFDVPFFIDPEATTGTGYPP